MTVTSIDRRAWLTGAAAVSAIGGTASAHAARFPWREPLVINSLGGLGDPNPALAVIDQPETEDEGPIEIEITDRAVKDALASGLSAVNLTVGYVAGPMEPFEFSVAHIAAWERALRRHKAHLAKIDTAADILAARRERKVGVYYGFQNAVQMGADAGRVRVFSDLGVKVFQLTYNPANTLGGGSMSKANEGLTPFGHKVVEAVNAARAMVDLSHSGQQICLDAARASKAPISINHTGCRALTDLPRNKTDEELKLVASKGGFVGIYFMPFLRLDGQARATDVVAHIEHAIKVCGEDHVGLGTDGGTTGIDDMEAARKALIKENAQRRAAGIAATGEGPDTWPFVIDLLGPGQYRKLADMLAARGHSTTRIEKILGGNFLRFAKDVWGG